MKIKFKRTEIILVLYLFLPFFYILTLTPNRESEIRRMIVQQRVKNVVRKTPPFIFCKKPTYVVSQIELQIAANESKNPFSFCSQVKHQDIHPSNFPLSLLQWP